MDMTFRKGIYNSAFVGKDMTLLKEIYNENIVEIKYDKK
jgi:hypothetical protein